MKNGSLSVQTQVRHPLTDNARRNSLFEMVDKENIQLFKRKSHIFSQGDEPNELYYIKNGKVKVSKVNSEGKEFSISILSEKSFLGHQALIENQKYSESAVSLEDTEIVSIPKEKFLRLLSNNRRVSIEFLKILNSQNKLNEKRLFSMAFDSVRKRTASALFDLCEIYKGPIKSSEIIINISRDDLASIVGTATETVIRCLSEFKDEGIIRVQGRKIYVSSLEKLKKLCL